MALSIIDGSNGNIDISIGAVSMKGHFGLWSAEFNRETFDATTFASGRWRAPIPMLQQLRVHAEGFVTKGDTVSDPLGSPLGFGSSTAAAAVLTADTSCTITGSLFVTGIRTSMRAAAASEKVLDAMSTGTVSTAWITS